MVRGAGVLLLLLSLPLPAEAKSFHLARTEIAAEVRGDGSMHVRETREYVFSGTFHHAYRVIPLPAGTQIESFLVTENGSPYQQTAGEAPDSFVTSRGGGQFRADWYYQASDESRLFTVDYDVTGAVVKHDDLAELYWKFVGTEWEARSELARVTISLPGRVPRAGLRAWAHGPLWGKTEIQEGRVDLTCNPLPPREMIGLRLLFPTDLIATSPRQDTATILPVALEEEGRWASQANRGG